MRTRTATTFDQDSARRYEFAHGHRPRGTGAWCFSLHRDGSSTDVWHNGRYTEARAAAMREARDLGCSTVTVNS